MNTHNQNALFKLSYGLYVLTAREGDKDNGCIINVAPQLTDTPLQMLVSVNKQNYTHDMIVRTGLFNVSPHEDGRGHEFGDATDGGNSQYRQEQG